MAQEKYHELRGTTPPDTTRFDVSQHRVSFNECKRNPYSLLQIAGSYDLEFAAGVHAERYQEPARRDTAFAACLEALREREAENQPPDTL